MARFVKDMTKDEIIKCIESMDNRFVLNAKDKHSLKVAVSAIKAIPWGHLNHKTLPPEKDIKLAPMQKAADTPPFYTPKAEFEKAHKSKILCPKCEYEESSFMPCNQCDDLGSQFREKTNLCANCGADMRSNPNRIHDCYNCEWEEDRDSGECYECVKGIQDHFTPKKAEGK